jgi:hypothetical protein
MRFRGCNTTTINLHFHSKATIRQEHDPETTTVKMKGFHRIKKPSCQIMLHWSGFGKPAKNVKITPTGEAVRTPAGDCSVSSGKARKGGRIHVRKNV